MEESGENQASVITANPSEGRNTKNFECPLCVEVFRQFSQLKAHLLSMHPRRPRIMELISERYGISERDEERPTSAICNTKNRPENSTYTEQGSGKLQSVVPAMRMSTIQCFKVPHQLPQTVATLPHKLRHKVAARPQIIDDQRET